MAREISFLLIKISPSQITAIFNQQQMLPSAQIISGISVREYPTSKFLILFLLLLSL